jgi:hypothetical protein
MNGSLLWDCAVSCPASRWTFGTGDSIARPRPCPSQSWLVHAASTRVLRRAFPSCRHARRSARQQREHARYVARPRLERPPRPASSISVSWCVTWAPSWPSTGRRSISCITRACIWRLNPASEQRTCQPESLPSPALRPSAWPEPRPGHRPGAGAVAALVPWRCSASRTSECRGSIRRGGVRAHRTRSLHCCRGVPPAPPAPGGYWQRSSSNSKRRWKQHCQRLAYLGSVLVAADIRPIPAVGGSTTLAILLPRLAAAVAAAAS